MCASLSGTSLLCFNEVLSPLFSYHADLKKLLLKCIYSFQFYSVIYFGPLVFVKYIMWLSY